MIGNASPRRRPTVSWRPRRTPPRGARRGAGAAPPGPARPPRRRGRSSCRRTIRRPPASGPAAGRADGSPGRRSCDGGVRTAVGRKEVLRPQLVHRRRRRGGSGADERNADRLQRAPWRGPPSPHRPWIAGKMTSAAAPAIRPLSSSGPVSPMMRSATDSPGIRPQAARHRAAGHQAHLVLGVRSAHQDEDGGVRGHLRSLI